MTEYSAAMKYVIKFLLKSQFYQSGVAYRGRAAELAQDIGGVRLSEGSEVFELTDLYNNKVIYRWHPPYVRGEIRPPSTIYADPVKERFFVRCVDPSRLWDIFSRQPKKIEVQSFDAQELLDFLLRKKDNKPQPPRRQKKELRILRGAENIYGLPQPI